MGKVPYRLIPINTKDGAVWYCRYLDPRTGKRNKFSTYIGTDEDKGRAHTVAAAKLAELSEGYSKTPRLEDYAADFFKWGVCPWIKRRHAKGHPFSEYQAQTRRAHLDNYIFPKFGKTRLDRLTGPMIDKWLIGLTQEDGKPLANQTKNHILYTFKIVLKEAKSEKLIRDNPLQDVDPLAKNHRERDAFALDELALLFPQTQKALLNVWKTQKYATLFMTMASTGIRSGEARALAWRHLLPGGWLFVERAVKITGEIGPTKTREKRVIAVPQRTQTQLAKWKKETPYKADDDLIFYGLGAGQPLDVETPTHFFPGALDRAKIVIAGRTLVPHCLRHTYNTIMRRVLPAEVLQRFTGHKSLEMTDWYDHLVMKDRIAELEPSRTLIEGVWK